MDIIFAELANALRERLAVIADDKSRSDSERHMERLRLISEKIEEIAGRLPGTVDAQLRHFLQRRSYSKALEFLESTPNAEVK